MSDPVFNISRTYDAPLSLVWDMYAKKEHLTKWWGPKGFEWVGGTLDFRPGGIFHYGMKSPTGDVMWGKFVYSEIVPLKKLVFTTSFSDENGGTTRAPFAANFPLEVLNTIEFSESAGKTTLSMTGTPFDASDADKAFFESMFPSMQQGFKGTLDQLEAYLKSQQ
ncbi:MAG TPA: SRPBCC domain-containing protein [Rhizomicrobium sp.]|nr:SRPBCC domain-containing protein [Rhizomicrobium sp.]